MAKNIGLELKPPGKDCLDRKCPFHGYLPVRRKTIEGRVVSARMRGTLVIQRDYVHYYKKFLRYERRRRRISAHNPPCIAAGEGDTVRIAECRPISKTVSYVVVEKISGAEA